MQQRASFLYTVFGLFLFCLVAPARAVPISRDVLAKELAYYQKIATLHTRFHETKTLKDMAMKLDSDGELTVIRPSKVIWKVVHPSALTVTLEAGRVQIEGANGTSENYAIEGNARESLKALVAWLKLDPDELLASYTISKAENGGFVFVPKGDAPIKSMTMALKPGSYLESLLIEEKSGDSLAIRFEKPTLTVKANGK